MESLTIDDFPHFFRQVTGHDPFQWQVRLAREVVAGNQWPEVLDLPTASGKTACIEIAVFHLALSMTTDGRLPKGMPPRRIFFVVDRRVIVDQAFRRARALATKLAEARDGVVKDPVVRTVSERLVELGGGSDLPLGVARLRGGMRRDTSWSGSLAQPAVIAGTVDQVGSRLLFRSYDGRPYSFPLQAGLVGNDSLILIDEAHCAQPFLETARAVRDYRSSRWAERSVGGAFGVVSLSATPGTSDPGNVFRLSVEERDDPKLAPRLNTPKPATLSVATKARVPRGGGPDEENAARLKLVDHMVDRTREVFRERHPDRTAVIVNRVATAAHVHRKLGEALKDEADLVLMTGRMRPLDRDELLRRWEHRLAAGADRSTLQRPVIVVATQTLEVGADFDFDVLVTEAASLDALRQRFGRLNRLGNSPEPGIGEIVVAEYQRKKSDDDPVYGAAIAETWKWLNSVAGDFDTVDFSDAELGSRWHDHPRPELLAPSSRAPVLLPAHIDRFVQTSPIPDPSPEPAFFLHGAEPRRAEVSVLWRSDLALPSVAEWRDHRSHRDEIRNRLVEAVSLCPPSSVESLTVSLAWLRRWLKGVDEVPVGEGDIEGRGEDDQRVGDSGQGGRTMLIWRGARDAVWTGDSREIRPGDTVILSNSESLGSFRPYLFPSEGALTKDLGDRAQAEARGRAVLRLHAGTVEHWPNEVVPDHIKALAREIANSEPETLSGDWIRGFLVELQSSLDESIPHAWRWLSRTVDGLLASRYKIHPYPADQSGSIRGVVLQGPPGSATPEVYTAGAAVPARLLAVLTEPEGLVPDAFSESSGEVLLKDHGRAVGELTRGLGRVCAVPQDLNEDLGVGGDHHDVGKSDPRFQGVLRGDGIPAVIGEPLAKSDSGPTTYWQDGWLRKRAGLPKGFRHELLSVRLIESMPEVLSTCSDPDLVLHVIAAHHGRCRPFAPVVQDDDPVNVGYSGPNHDLRASSATGLERLDSGVSERFWWLVRRYGWWGLAYLEAVLISADHLVSAAEQSRVASAEVVT